MTSHINEINESAATFAVYVLAGMTIGLALGMLLAPSSGSEARQYIRGRVRDLQKSTKNLRRTTGSSDRLEVAEDA